MRYQVSITVADEQTLSAVLAHADSITHIRPLTSDLSRGAARLLTQAGWTQDSIATLLGVAQSTVNVWVRKEEGDGAD